MKPSEYASHDALGLASLVEAGEVSPEELVEISIGLIEDLDPTLNAVIAYDPDPGDEAQAINAASLLAARTVLAWMASFRRMYGSLLNAHQNSQRERSSSSWTPRSGSWRCPSSPRPPSSWGRPNGPRS